MVTANPLGDLDEYGIADMLSQQRGMNAQK
jgi:hypothetical protein